MYAGKKQFNGGGFPGIGKTGKTNFKNGKPHQSVFLIEGYKQLKQMQGYESSFVNLTYSADLKLDFANSLTAKNDCVLSGVSNNANVLKIEGLTEKYGNDLFNLTEEEKNHFETKVAQAVSNYLFGK